MKRWFKERCNVVWAKTTLGNTALYVYSKYRQYYPICKTKINIGFMMLLRKVIEYSYDNDYTKNKSIKYLYERFNNDEQYIEEIIFRPVLKMDTKIIRSFDESSISLSSLETSTTPLSKTSNPNSNSYPNPNQYLDSECFYSKLSGLFVFNKIIRGTTYFRIFTKNEFELLKTHKSEQDIQQEIYSKFELVKNPFVFFEITYEDLETKEWRTILPYEQIKSLCVEGNKLSLDTLQFICMKYFNINLHQHQFKVNILFSKSETIEEYDRNKFIHEPIIL